MSEKLAKGTKVEFTNNGVTETGLIIQILGNTVYIRTALGNKYARRITDITITEQ